MKNEAPQEMQKGSSKRPLMKKRKEPHQKDQEKRGTGKAQKYSSENKRTPKLASLNPTVEGEGDAFWFKSQTTSHTKSAN
jgi:hypothetical protein